MSTNANILSNMNGSKWNYAFDDDQAFQSLKARVEATGRKRELIYYSDLVAGIEFRLPSVSQQPHVVDVHAWIDLDRQIVGEFLGRLSMESYRDHGFMASALAIGREGDKPSKHFFNWMREIGALRSKSEFAELEFWSSEVTRAHDHYGRRTTGAH